MRRTLRGLLSFGMAAALFLYPNITVLAQAQEAVTETTAVTAVETVPETTAVTEPAETIPETTAVTEPAETVPETTAVTEPPETVPETTAATEPAETVPETTAASEPGETIPETTAATEPEETVPVTQPVTESPVLFLTRPLMANAAPLEEPISIAEAKALDSGTEGITLEGVVVLAVGTTAVLQDETGGIRLSFRDTPAVKLGDTLLVTGKRSGGLSVESCTVTGTAELPAIKTTLADAEEEVRIHIEGAVLGSRELQQQGTDCSLAEAVPDSFTVGDRVDAWGVILDGWFYADTILPAAQREEEGSASGEWKFYFGQLHAHTADSDGAGTPAEAYAAAKAAGLDFFAVTDHSNSFDNDTAGAIGADGAAISSEWAAGKMAAEEATDAGFVGLYGYEMSWGEDLAIGHINTFRTPGWQSRNQDGFQTLQQYCEALSTIPGSISQFNHPSPDYGDFGRFRKYDPFQDSVMHLMEVGSENGQTAYDYYTRALDAGWHLAPTNSEATHDAAFAQTSVRTVVLAKELSEESLYDAMENHRLYASEDADLEILYTMNGQVMGSVIPRTEAMTVAVSLRDPTDASIGTVEVITYGGSIAASQTVSEQETQLTMAVASGASYYYLRITQPDGDIAVTAPVWVDDFDQLGIAAFTADAPQPEVGQAVTLKLELFNDESRDFYLDSVVVSENGTPIYEVEDPGTVPAYGSRSISIPYLCEAPGRIPLTVSVRGTIAGLSREDTEELAIHGQPGDVAVSAISDTRKGLLGEAYCVRGYVTAGTSNPSNTFENTLYIQDDTGGIAVVDFTDTGIQVGTAMEITGILRRLDGNIVLALTDYEILQEARYRYVPRTMTHEVAMDYDTHGGELLQIEGSVVSLTKTADGKGISRFTLKDLRGDLATVIIEDGIGSIAYGTNELASQVRKGRTVRAMGLLHIDEFGKTVLRVRNCEEVVYVPPVSDPTNPKTVDRFLLWK